jgi:probable phosphoglycerate mutase
MSDTRTLLLSRHGETDWNAAGRWQGQTDIPLNGKGRAQAFALAERMRLQGVAAIASSDLSRARETAEIVAQALGLAVSSLEPDLREQRFGEFEGLTRAECQTRFPDAWARYVADAHATPPGGESRAALVARVVPAIHSIAERLASPVLVIMHGGAMRALFRDCADAIPDPASAEWARHGIPNGGVFRVTIASRRIVEAVRLETAPA